MICVCDPLIACVGDAYTFFYFILLSTLFLLAYYAIGCGRPLKAFLLMLHARKPDEVLMVANATLISSTPIEHCQFKHTCCGRMLNMYVSHFQRMFCKTFALLFSTVCHATMHVPCFWFVCFYKNSVFPSEICVCCSTC